MLLSGGMLSGRSMIIVIWVFKNLASNKCIYGKNVSAKFKFVKRDWGVIGTVQNFFLYFRNHLKEKLVGSQVAFCFRILLSNGRKNRTAFVVPLQIKCCVDFIYSAIVNGIVANDCFCPLIQVVVRNFSVNLKAVNLCKRLLLVPIFF